MSLIRAAHLSKRFGEVLAVDDLSLNVSAGEIYGLVGPDGAGKTTTMRLLCGAYPPSPGIHPAQIEIDGWDVVRQREQARERLGYLPQRFSLYEELTVLENIRFFAEVRGLTAEEWRPRSEEILDFVGLSAFTERRAGALSGGMKQKLGLAVALVHRPRVLLLDEPTTGVDPVTRQDFWQLIIRLVSQRDEQGRAAVLVSTPYMDEASRCTRLGFMRQGRLMAEGSPAELLHSFDGCIIEVKGSPLMVLRQLAHELPDVEDVSMFGDRLHLKLKPKASSARVIQQMQNMKREGSLRIDQIEKISPGLEDVFMEYMRREG